LNDDEGKIKLENDRKIKLENDRAIKQEYDRKFKLEYDKLNPQSNPSNDLVRKKEQKIVNTILAYEGGISHQELANMIGIDRNNLRRYMNRLMNRGLVTRDKGQHGKYYPTNKARRGISISADILANSCVSNILDNDKFLIDIPSLETNIIPFSGLEYKLLKLSNMFGGFMIYAMIQSMNPENKITQTWNLVEEDIAVQAWLEDVILIFMKDILSRFKSHVFDDLKSLDQILLEDLPPKSSRSKIRDKNFSIAWNFFNQRPYFTLDQRIISELIGSFSNLYPKLSRVLEKTRSELPKLLEKEINNMRYREEASKVQKICKHKYEKPSIRFIDPNLLRDPRDVYEHCRKCHHTRWKKN
jgi:DNA-binding MarR family transcriptional regulator